MSTAFLFCGSIKTAPSALLYLFFTNDDINDGIYLDK